MIGFSGNGCVGKYAEIILTHDEHCVLAVTKVSDMEYLVNAHTLFSDFFFLSGMKQLGLVIPAK